MKDNSRSDQQSQLLAKGFGMLMGEAVFAVNGPFLFSRFGLNVPLAAAAGCLVGAMAGYVFVGLLFWLRHTKHTVAPAPEVKHEPMLRAA